MRCRSSDQKIYSTFSPQQDAVKIGPTNFSHMENSSSEKGLSNEQLEAFINSSMDQLIDSYQQQMLALKQQILIQAKQQIIGRNQEQILNRVNVQMAAIDHTLQKLFTEHLQTISGDIILRQPRKFNFRKFQRKPLFSLRGHTSEILQVIKLNSHHIISCANDATVKFWNLSTKSCQHTL